MASKKILCPYCFEEFNNTDAWYQCESDDRNMDGNYRCDRVSSTEFDTYWGSSGSQIRYVWPQKGGLKARLFGPSLGFEKCPQCGYRSRRFVCPHCFNWLPTDMIENGAEIISVIGSPSSGKTNYIVALIHELKKYGYKLNLEAVPAQTHRDGYPKESTQKMYNSLEKEMFKDKQVLQKTREDKKDIPWIFRLSQQHTKKQIYLVFYDTAGEKFDSNLQNNVKYLRESSGVILLLDTLGIDYIHNILKKNGLEDSGGKVKEPLDSIITPLTQDSHYKDMIARKPMAFVFSKFDAVLDHSKELEFGTDEFKQGNKRLNSSYRETGVLDLDRLNSINKSIELAMKDEEHWDQGPLWKFAHDWAAKKFSSLPPEKHDMDDPDNNYRFFGVSALGGMPDQLGSLEKVEPYRVMDPLLWVLYKLGQFDIPTKK